MVVVSDPPEAKELVASVVLAGGSVLEADMVTASVSCLLSRAMTAAEAAMSNVIYRTRRSRGIMRMVKYQEELSRVLEYGSL